MLRKTITYIDYDGKERTEEYHFNLTKIEMSKLFNSKVNLRDKLDDAIKNGDEVGIIETFEELISKSYGIKSDGGKQFKKSKELSEAFLQTAAFESLLDELLTKEDQMVKFIEGIIPAAVAEQLAANVAGETIN